MDEKILKADVVLDKVVGSTPKVLKREAYEASREARDVVTQAQEKAKQIVEEAMRERDRIREQGRQEGNAEGLAAWNDILIRSRKRSDELTKNWEETMLQLSVHIARKIIGEELTQHPETILAIVREVIKGTRTGKRILPFKSTMPRPSTCVRKSIALRQFLGGGSDIELFLPTVFPPAAASSRASWELLMRASKRS